MEALWLKSQVLNTRRFVGSQAYRANTLRKYLRLFSCRRDQETDRNSTSTHRQANWSAIVINLRPISANIARDAQRAAAKIGAPDFKRKPKRRGSVPQRARHGARDGVGTIPSKADPEKQEIFRVTS